MSDLHVSPVASLRRGRFLMMVLFGAALLVLNLQQYLWGAIQRGEQALEAGLAVTSRDFSMFIHPHNIQGQVWDEFSKALDLSSSNCQGHMGVKYVGSSEGIIQPTKQFSAETCCAACTAASDQGCNSWSYCAHSLKCKAELGACTLLHLPDPTRPVFARVGPEVGWTTGLVVAARVLPQLLTARGLTPLCGKHMVVGLHATTGTLSVLSPIGEPSFSFMIAHNSSKAALSNSAGGFHHWGDISLRVRKCDDAAEACEQVDSAMSGIFAWRSLSSVASPQGGVPLPSPPPARALLGQPPGTAARAAVAAGWVDLAPQLPPDAPVTITRWVELPRHTSTAPVIDEAATAWCTHSTSSEKDAGADEDWASRHGVQPTGDVLLQEEVRVYWNISVPVTAEPGLLVGSLGLSMPFDQLFLERTLEYVALQCSFVEAYPGGQLGYIQVTRASGAGPVLLVLPAPGVQGSPRPRFEAWRPLKALDASQPGFGFEGHHELLLHSLAWAVADWGEAQPWVAATSHFLQPGQSLVVGIRLLLVSGPEQVEAALLAAGHPVVVGVPGYVVHADMQDARLIVRLPPKPGPALKLHSIVVEPQGSLQLEPVEPHWPPGGGREVPGQQQVLTYRLTLPLRPNTSSVMNEPLAWAACPAHDKSPSCISQHPSQGGGERVVLEQSAGACPLLHLGRVRLRLQFEQPTTPEESLKGAGAPIKLEQVVQLMVLPPAQLLVRQYGLKSADPKHGWLAADVSDPWHRSPAFMGYDNEVHQPVMHELRTYIAGLSDEAGAAQPLAMAIKQLGLPSRDQVHKLEQYVHYTLWARKGQNPTNFIQNQDFSVRSSMLYSTSDALFATAQPEFINQCAKQAPFWQVCWDEQRSLQTWRSFNYPHVAALYWSLYRVGRFGPQHLLKFARAKWYLRQAAQTTLAMWKYGKGYGRWGLMVGSVFVHILEDVLAEEAEEDLKALQSESPAAPGHSPRHSLLARTWSDILFATVAKERTPVAAPPPVMPAHTASNSWTEERVQLEALMAERVSIWQAETFPHRSKMSWDNTGHEEIYSWLDAHNDVQGMETTAQAVLAYMGTSPHWAVAGSARRWWDFFINGKVELGGERVFHHYAGALNAIPLAKHFRRHPDRLHLLRVATAGTMGSLTNIKPDGGASMGWHGDPTQLRLDGYSADYGIGFYGHQQESGATLACDARMGWLCFGCDIVPPGPGDGGSHGLREPTSDNQLGSTHLRGLLSASRGSQETLAAGSGGSNCDVLPSLVLIPRDAFRQRLFIAPLALLFTVHQGATILEATLDLATSQATIILGGLEGSLIDGGLSPPATADTASDKRDTVPFSVEVTAPQGSHGAVVAPASLSAQCGLGWAASFKLGGSKLVPCEHVPLRGKDTMRVTVPLRREYTLLSGGVTIQHGRFARVHLHWGK